MKDHPTRKPACSVLHVAAAAAALVVAGSCYGQDIVQNVKSSNTSSEWNDAIWNSAAPTGGNTYVSTAGLDASNNSFLGTNLTGRVRAYAGSNGDPTFAGDSLRIVTATELLLKDNGTYSANLILDGGVLRFAPNAAGSATFAGTIEIATASIAGVVQSGVSTLTFDSAITGSADLRLAAGQNAGNSLVFSDTSDFSAYSGTLFIGGGATTVTVSFGLGTHDLGNASLNMNNSGTTTDVLNLAGAVTVSAFTIGATSLDDGLYTVEQLNTISSGQFTGTGSLQVGAIPEPSTYAALAGLAGLVVVALRRRRRGA